MSAFKKPILAKINNLLERLLLQILHKLEKLKTEIIGPNCRILVKTHASVYLTPNSYLEQVRDNLSDTFFIISCCLVENKPLSAQLFLISLDSLIL